MSNSQPEVKTEERKTRRSKAWNKLVDNLKKLTTELKKKISKNKKRLKGISSGKTTRSRQKAMQKEELSSETTTRKQQKAKRKAEKKQNKKPRRRAFPIWLRIIVVILLCAIALVIGAIVGYAIIGSGKPSDALDMDTWRHIIEIVTKTE
ncbi:DNA-directed RNA polymerase subunit beta [Virgibacillus necropolis]|nr:DNA-directed RNA polymerase subunit beta [Virgibacillus necropolis]